MPLKVRRLWISCLVLSAASTGTALAQQTVAINQPSSGMAAATTNTANAAQQKIARVRALIAARNYVAATSELEKIRKETGDEALQQVAQTMLIAVYLEQPDYTRALSLLEDSFKRNKIRKTGVDEGYLAVAGQIIKGAQSQLERYKRLGLSSTDPNLPTEATNDLDRWRSMLETIINQAKQMSVEAKQPASALALLEDAANTRGILSRDQYEVTRWKNEVTDTRELMANAQMKVAEVDENLQLVATNLPPKTAAPQNASMQNASLTNNATSSSIQNAVEQKTSVPQVAGGQSNEALSQSVLPKAPENKSVEDMKKPENSVAQTPSAEIKNEKPASEQVQARQRVVATNAFTEKTVEAPKEAAIEKAATATAVKNNEPMVIGSLVDMATRKVNPTYPPVAKTARIGGIVRVEVILDEQGSVAEIKNANGPELLKRAATDAVKNWKFKPVMRDGLPVRASGFVNFNFAL